MNNTELLIHNDNFEYHMKYIIPSGISFTITCNNIMNYDIKCISDMYFYIFLEFM